MGIWDLWNRKSSKDFAKDRLKLLLVSDRAGCSSEVMDGCTAARVFPPARI